MRRLLSTVVLVLVFAGLGSYIYFDTSDVTEDSTPAKEKVFPGLQYDQIAEFTVKSKSGDVSTVKKESGAWQLVAPARAKANESDIAALGAAVSNMEISRVIEDSAADLKAYGLDAPQMEVAYKTSDGKSEGRLLVGQNTSTGSGLYAKRSDTARVFLIPSYEEAILNKSTFDLRDKALVSFERDKVNAIDVVAGGTTVALAKDGSNWNLTTPLVERADSTSVSSLMDRVDSSQMKSVVTENATEDDLKKYGLIQPAASVTLNQGGTLITLLIGGKADEKTVYARGNSKPIVGTIDNTILDDITKGPDNYRRKDLFEFRPFSATRVEFTRGSQTVAFERVKGGPDKLDTWRRAPAAATDLDTNKVETMLGDFADLHLDSFVDKTAKTGLESPSLLITAQFGDDKDKKEEKVRFAEKGSDVFARTGESTPGRLDPQKYKDAIMRLDELAK